MEAQIRLQDEIAFLRQEGTPDRVIAYVLRDHASSKEIRGILRSDKK
jgi:hypothetical protein